MKVENPVLELKKTKLYKELAKKHEEYAKKALSFVSCVAPVLALIEKHFPYYTRHDAHHSYRVLKRIEQIVYPGCLNGKGNLEFSPDEIYLLICACYAHDIGMTIFPDESDDILTQIGVNNKLDDWRTNATLQKYLRDNHSSRGGKYIRENLKKLDFPLNLLEPVKLLMESHNMTLEEINEKLKGPFAAGEKELDLMQLAAIFCTADLIEYSDTRVIDGIIENLADTDNEELKFSYLENMKHLSVSDSLTISKYNRIVISGSFVDAEVLNLAYKYSDSIAEWVKIYKGIDEQSTIPRLKIQSNIEVHFLASNFDFERLGIRIKKENILRLITSNSLWNQPVFSVKELLQNSVEACRYRQYRASLSENYQPKICLTFNETDRTIKLLDNGCGMTKDVIKNNFLNVGNSRSRSSTYSAHSYTSLARFGIGFWSVFSVCSEATIETIPQEEINIINPARTKYEGTKFKVSIDYEKDYTVFDKIYGFVGTVIILKLHETINLREMYRMLKHHFLCSSIPVIFKYINKFTEEWPSKPIPPSMFELFGAKTSFAIGISIKLFVWEKKLGQEIVVLCFPYRKSNANVSLLFENRRVKDLVSIEQSGRCQLSICGFSYNLNLNNLLFDISLSGSFVIHTENPAGIKFSLNRQSLLDSNRLEEIKKESKLFVYDALKQFLKENDCLNLETIHRITHESMLNGGSKIRRSYAPDSLATIYQEAKEFMVFKLAKIERGKTYSTSTIEYLTIDDLLKRKYTVWTFQDAVREVRLWPHPETEEYFNQAYHILSSRIEEGLNYFHEPSILTTLLFDNIPESEIFVIEIFVTPTQKVFLPYMRIDTAKYIPDYSPASNVMGNFRGIIAGTVIVKKINGARQFFLGNANHQNLIVDPDSLLKADLEKLFQSNQENEVIEIIRAIEETLNGFPVERVMKYFQ
jgi:hypothetical protein